MIEVFEELVRFCSLSGRSRTSNELELNLLQKRDNRTIVTYAVRKL